MGGNEELLSGFEAQKHNWKMNEAIPQDCGEVPADWIVGWARKLCTDKGKRQEAAFGWWHWESEKENGPQKYFAIPNCYPTLCSPVLHPLSHWRHSPWQFLGQPLQPLAMEVLNLEFKDSQEYNIERFLNLDGKNVTSLWSLTISLFFLQPKRKCFLNYKIGNKPP